MMVDIIKVTLQDDAIYHPYTAETLPEKFSNIMNAIQPHIAEELAIVIERDGKEFPAVVVIYPLPNPESLQTIKIIDTILGKDMEGL